MAHLSETYSRLEQTYSEKGFEKFQGTNPNVELVILPYFKDLIEVSQKQSLFDDLNDFLNKCHPRSTIAILTSPILAADFCTNHTTSVHLKLWVSIKLAKSIVNFGELSQNHASLLIFTRYPEGLNHTKTRIGYSYCPSCDRTTKDYGGKKHLYHEFGTLMSDVWRDIDIDFEQIPIKVIDRLQDLFGVSEYKSVNVYDWRKIFPRQIQSKEFKEYTHLETINLQSSLLLNGDCLENLKSIPDNSIDFCFADPPYNIKKKYENWNDGIDIQEYFKWCDDWLTEMARVLKPGCTLAVLNIPQWCIRHFKHLNSILDFQDWIVWEGLSLPVRMIMPAHYSILCFSKGKPRPLPGLMRINNSPLEKSAIMTSKEGFCVRSSCINKRRKQKNNDTEISSNIWWDIHRLKHNSRRVDHPCQLPPMFMYRLISMFTNVGEYILDPFNGAGTTTLAAEQLKRNYVGIELSEYYHRITQARHFELENGSDPFGKNSETPKTKNSHVKRLIKQSYEVSKKKLQLEVKQIAQKLGRKPTREDIVELSQYPIEYYENYFVSWGEVTAAARTTGMSEFKNGDSQIETKQLKLFKENMPSYTL